MNTELDVLARLGELNEADRSWILSKLPAHSRKKLLAAVTNEPAEPNAPSLRETKAAPARLTSSDDAEEFSIVRRADPSTLADVLRNEPAYIVAALISAHRWPWRDALIQAMPHFQRAEIVNLSEKIQLTSEMCASIVKLAAKRLSRVEPSPQPRSRFEMLVERIAAARSRKRSTLL